jgi:hypothetical protein
VGNAALISSIELSYQHPWYAHEERLLISGEITMTQQNQPNPQQGNKPGQPDQMPNEPGQSGQQSSSGGQHDQSTNKK